MAEENSQKPFAREYERLRRQLLDLSRRNPMLSYKHRAGSRRQIRIVDTTLQAVLTELLDNEGHPIIAALPEPDDVPPEEKTPEFLFALNQARASDIEYLTRLESLDAVGRQEEAELDKLECWLRDHIRAQLGLPPRIDSHDVSLVDQARRCNINPNFDLESGTSSGRLKELQTLYFSEDLNARLGRIAADAKLAEQETGLSTLFLAFGFLRWFDSSASKVSNFAPLLLLPVEIVKTVEKRKITYRLQSGGDSPEANLTLREFLTRNSPDVPRTLPEFDPETDGVDSYLSKVSETIEGIPDWRIERYLTLGHFSFGRLALYADLEPDNWKSHPLDNEILNNLMRGSEGGSIDFDRLMFAQDYLVDDVKIEDQAPILINNADASQHSAIIDVMQSRNLVIEGPPGTGKSQTITNIIANALFNGKTVLFLADKQSALEVVQSRLKTAGLGEFCLELHSHKAQSKAVVDSLRERCLIQNSGDENTAWKPVLSTLRGVRSHVTEYLNSLHESTDDGDDSAFKLFWAAIAGRRGLEIEFEALRKINLKAVWDLDRTSLEQARDVLDIYAATVANFETQFGHAFLDSAWNTAGLTLTVEADPYEIGDLIEALARLGTELNTEVHSQNKSLNLSLPTRLFDLKHWVQTVDELPTIEDDSFLPQVASFPPNETEQFAQLASERLRLQRTTNRIMLPYDPTLTLAIAKLAEKFGFGPISPVRAIADLQLAADRGAKLIEVVRLITPVVSAFQLPTEPTVKTAVAIAKAIKFATTIQSVADKFLSFNTEADQGMLAAGSEQLKYLNSTDKQLRTDFAYSSDIEWPDIDALEAALELSLATPLRRILSFFSDKRRHAIRAISTLNRRYGEQTLPSELNVLIEHVRLRNSFLSNVELIDAVGTYWNGLRTPLPVLNYVKQLRGYYDAKILPLDQATETIKPWLFSSIKFLTALKAYAQRAELLLSETAKWSAQLNDIPIKEVPNYIGIQSSSLEQLVDGVRAAGLEAIELSFEMIEKQALNRIQISQIDRQLAAHPIYNLISTDILENEPRCRSIFDAAETVRQLARADVPSALRDIIVKDGGAKFRRSLDLTSQKLQTLMTGFVDKAKRLSEYMKRDSDFERTDFAELATRLNQLIPAVPSLSAWSQVFHQRARVSSGGLLGFVDAFEGFRFSPSKMIPAFDALAAYRRATRARLARPPLQSGTGIEIEKRRNQFGELDRELQKRQRVALRAKLLQRQPLNGNDNGPKKKWTEMHCLRHEFTKQRHAPIRDMVSRAGRSIQSLMPCFMMSPLSLAKFLPADAIKFDILVVDEASQMRPEDSLGGLLRADQIVVVGDPKQLPPSDFFSRVRQDEPLTEDDEDDDLNAESILDWCLRTYSSPRRLTWHYRSQCESLIAFSNRYFYDNNLITFPTSHPDAFSVSLVPLVGNYKKGRNPIEASRVVETVIDFMIQNANLSPNKIPTLGVVAINSEQRELILEEFNRAANHPEIDQYVAACESATEARGPEGFFVKNLENVQGDERDVIIISLTYGREQGQESVAQRFGPINRGYGHRRLNVLFTRARKQIVLFSSMTSQDIVVSPSSKRGVRVLRDYLKYAESRRLEAGIATGRDFDSDFEREVCERLRESGFDVDPQVGVGGYRIDLGIRHPDHPSIYLAGIECDGATYHSAKSSRDRDKIRESVLRGLGWRLLRIWSTDWFADPDAQTSEIIRKLRALAQERHPISNQWIVVPQSEGAPDTAFASEDIAQDVDLPKSNGLNKQRGLYDTGDSGAYRNENVSIDEARMALRALRDDIIFAEFPGAELERSILRDRMIEKIIETRLDEPNNFSSKIPLWLRERTDPRQIKYLEEVCAIVERIS